MYLVYTSPFDNQIHIRDVNVKLLLEPIKFAEHYIIFIVRDFRSLSQAQLYVFVALRFCDQEIITKFTRLLLFQ